ncbi:MAG: hypothetical protein AAFR31_17275, partial [Cyanobacteria bacterium J06627_8]
MISRTESQRLRDRPSILSALEFIAISMSFITVFAAVVDCDRPRFVYSHLAPAAEEWEKGRETNSSQEQWKSFLPTPKGSFTPC